jgi:L-aspartate oxidase
MVKNPEFLVIGAGVAGLRAAIELAGTGSVLVVAKCGLRESSSEYAQGGIAVALNDDDEVELHEKDTLFAGDGLCDRAAVRTLVEEGPAAVRQLIDWGAEFDRAGGALAFTREGAHSRNRVLHAHGDSTGHEIARALYHKAAAIPNITLRGYAATIDLLVSDRGVSGALLLGEGAAEPEAITAHSVLLATGGLACVFRNSTNPEVATGDGVAMAYRAGATIGDIEFVQFHPTALCLEGAPRFLLSEALRGEGAVLRNTAGERFMPRYHAMAELAPRDVVARAIAAEMCRTGASHVLLDLTHRGPEFIRARFPRICETCARYGVDIATEPAPVAPAAHYAMGGVRTDLNGQTSLPGLFAAGEAASTGVHGANRLASNSLLEGLVFGARAGRAMSETLGRAVPAGGRCDLVPPPDASAEEIRSMAWNHCGIVRSAAGLTEVLEWLERRAFKPGKLSPKVCEARNIHQVLTLIARCALAREESRGAHYRADYPDKRPEFEKHSAVRKGCPVEFR